MSLKDFLDDPWKKSHPSFGDSPLNIRPAPEFATGEVVLASMIRAVGFETVGEGAVPRQGKDFDKAAQASRNREEHQLGLRPDSWRAVLHGILESPKQPNQSAKRFLQLTPVVPDVALYSGSARLTANSWNPGELVARMVRMGSATEEEAAELWRRLFKALSVDEQDDVWARWLDHEFQKRSTLNCEWKETALPPGPDFNPAAKAVLRMPATRFVRDISAVLDTKLSMTRRQWISLMEAVLRIGVVSHVLWLCRANQQLWSAADAILRGAKPEPNAGRIAITGRGQFLRFGNPGMAPVTELASRYLESRLGLNTLLWSLDEAGIRVPRLDGPESFQELLELADTQRRGATSEVLARVADLRDEHATALGCSSGIGSNLCEFAKHVLGQRQTANEVLRGYDQGYFLKKQGEHRGARWIVSLGPVAVLSLVHCCLQRAAGPSSIQRLSDHLAEYGLSVDRDDIASSELGHKLRTLGLVLDSPDAESGMLLVEPFSGAFNGGEAKA